MQNFSERQILWSLCLVVFLAFTLKLPIQTSLSVAPKLTVSLHSGEKCEKFRKTSTPLEIDTRAFRHNYLFGACPFYSAAFLFGSIFHGQVGREENVLEANCRFCFTLGNEASSFAFWSKQLDYNFYSTTATTFFDL